MIKYTWVIDTDHENTHPSPEDSYSVPLFGPGGITEDQQATLRKATIEEPGGCHRFQMKDADGILYYSGWFLGDAGDENAFGPLDDFGKADVGCTSIEYLNRETGRWEEL